MTKSLSYEVSIFAQLVVFFMRNILYLIISLRSVHQDVSTNCMCVLKVTLYELLAKYIFSQKTCSSATFCVNHAIKITVNLTTFTVVCAVFLCLYHPNKVSLTFRPFSLLCQLLIHLCTDKFHSSFPIKHSTKVASNTFPIQLWNQINQS